MHRYFVTGTDTDVGKTRVVASLGLAMRQRGLSPTIVKLVQTGADEAAEGDARHAGALTGLPHVELARFFKPADPWSAALAEGMPPVHAEDLKFVLDRIDGAVIAEGAGGVAVPLNRRQSLADVAQLAQLEAVLAIGLRLGCISHALLTVSRLEEHGVPIAGAVLVERWNPTEEHFRVDVTRGLAQRIRMLGTLRFEVDERRSMEEGAKLFEALLSQRNSGVPLN